MSRICPIRNECWPGVLYKPTVYMDLPCSFACPHGAITKSSTSAVPTVHYDKCIGCMECVYQCPGLAIFGYHIKKDMLFLPVEYEAQEGQEVYLVNNNGEKLGGCIGKNITEAE